MKLGALKQGDRFRYPGQVDGFYVKGSEIPGTLGEQFYIHSGSVVYTGGGFFDEEVIKVGNINEE